MKKFARKFLLLSVATGLVATNLVGCSQEQKPATEDQAQTSGDTTGEAEDTKKEETSKSKYTTAVVASLEMNGVFSPFFATTGYDLDISNMVHAALIKSDRNAQPEANLAEYAIEEVKGDDGTITETIYTFTIKEGAVFSDGQPVTADDIIFSYKVLADPTYDGPSTFVTLPVVGL
ncbi:MAG: ABC transporter substrate-binding protein, partial [Niameybacter sp.]